MRSGQRQAPPCGRMTARYLYHDAKKCFVIELVPTEHFGLQDPIESSIDELLLDFVRKMSPLLSLVLRLPQQRSHRGRARDQILWSEVRFRCRQALAHGLNVHFYLLIFPLSAVADNRRWAFMQANSPFFCGARAPAAQFRPASGKASLQRYKA